MSVKQTLVTEFLNLVVEELNEADLEATPAAAHQLLTKWCEVYEDVPPRNRAEVAVRDALEEARDVAYARRTPTFLLKPV